MSSRRVCPRVDIKDAIEDDVPDLNAVLDVSMGGRMRPREGQESGERGLHYDPLADRGRDGALSGVCEFKSSVARLFRRPWAISGVWVAAQN